MTRIAAIQFACRFVAEVTVRWKSVGSMLGFIFVAALSGVGTSFVLLLAYAVGKLYLAGHSIEPSWYETVGSIVVFGCGFVVAIWMFVTLLRAQRPRPGA